MPCGKPGGDPAAIFNAADGIDSYADGIAQVFSIMDGSDAPLDSWTGTAAASMKTEVASYRSQLDDYADKLHDYASQIRDYATQLEASQHCSIWDILTWVFTVIFVIIEIIIGVFGGGALMGSLAILFGAMMETLMDVVGTVGEVIGETLGETLGSVLGDVARLADIVTDFSEAGSTFGELPGKILEAGFDATKEFSRDFTEDLTVKGISSKNPGSGGIGGQYSAFDAGGFAADFLPVASPLLHTAFDGVKPALSGILHFDLGGLGSLADLGKVVGLGDVAPAKEIGDSEATAAKDGMVAPGAASGAGAEPDPYELLLPPVGTPQQLPPAIQQDIPDPGSPVYQAPPGSSQQGLPVFQDVPLSPQQNLPVYQSPAIAATPEPGSPLHEIPANLNPPESPIGLDSPFNAASPPPGIMQTPPHVMDIDPPIARPMEIDPSASSSPSPSLAPSSPSSSHGVAMEVDNPPVDIPGAHVLVGDSPAGDVHRVEIDPAGSPTGEPPAARVGGSTAGGSSISFDAPVAHSSAAHSSVAIDPPATHEHVGGELDPSPEAPSDVWAALTSFAGEPRPSVLSDVTPGSPGPTPGAQLRKILDDLPDNDLDALLVAVPGISLLLSRRQGLPVHRPGAAEAPVGQTMKPRNVLAGMSDDEIDQFLTNEPGIDEWVRAQGAGPAGEPSSTAGGQTRAAGNTTRAASGPGRSSGDSPRAADEPTGASASTRAPTLVADVPTTSSATIAGPPDVSTASAMQQRVLRLVWEGLTPRQIGDVLGIAVSQVHSYRLLGLQHLTPETRELFARVRPGVARAVDVDVPPAFSAADIDALPYYQRMVVKLTAMGLPAEGIAEALGVGAEEIPALEHRAYESLGYPVATLVPAAPTVRGRRVPLAPTTTNIGALAQARERVYTELGRPTPIGTAYRPGATAALTPGGRSLTVTPPEPGTVLPTPAPAAIVDITGGIPGMPNLVGLRQQFRDVLLLTSEGVDDTRIGGLLNMTNREVRYFRLEGLAKVRIKREELGPYAPRATIDRPGAPRGELEAADVNGLPYYQRNVIAFMARNTTPESTPAEVEALLQTVAGRLEISPATAGTLETTAYRHLGIRLSPERARERILGFFNHSGDPISVDPAIVGAPSPARAAAPAAATPATATPAPIAAVPTPAAQARDILSTNQIDTFLTSIDPDIANWIHTLPTAPTSPAATHAAGTPPTPTAQSVSPEPIPERPNPGQIDFGDVSERMEEVLRLATEGFSDEEIATFLGIGTGSVRGNRSNAFARNTQLSSKLGPYAAREPAALPLPPVGPITREDINALPYFQRQIIEHIARNNMPGTATTADIQRSLDTINTAFRLRPNEAAMLEKRAYQHLGITGTLQAAREQIHTIMRNNGEPVATAKRRAYESDDEGEGSPKDGMVAPGAGQTQQGIVQPDPYELLLPPVGQPLPAPVDIVDPGTPVYQNPVPSPGPDLPLYGNPVLSPQPDLPVYGNPALSPQPDLPLYGPTPLTPQQNLPAYQAIPTPADPNLPIYQSVLSPPPAAAPQEIPASATPLGSPEPDSPGYLAGSPFTEPLRTPSPAFDFDLPIHTPMEIDPRPATPTPDSPTGSTPPSSTPPGSPTPGGTPLGSPPLNSPAADTPMDIDPTPGNGLPAAPGNDLPVGVPLNTSGDLPAARIGGSTAGGSSISFDAPTGQTPSSPANDPATNDPTGGNQLAGDEPDPSAAGADDVWAALTTFANQPQSPRLPNANPAATANAASPASPAAGSRLRNFLNELPDESLETLVAALPDDLSLFLSRRQGLPVHRATTTEAPVGQPINIRDVIAGMTDHEIDEFFTSDPDIANWMRTRGAEQYDPSTIEFDTPDPAPSPNGGPIVADIPTTSSTTIPEPLEFTGISTQQARVLRLFLERFSPREIGDLLDLTVKQVTNSRFAGLGRLSPETRRLITERSFERVGSVNVDAPPTFSAADVDRLPYYQRMVIKLTAMGLPEQTIAGALRVPLEEIPALERKAYENLNYPVAFAAPAPRTARGTRVPLAPTTTNIGLLAQARQRVFLELGQPAPIAEVRRPGTTVTLAPGGRSITVTPGAPGISSDPPAPSGTTPVVTGASPAMPNLGGLSAGQRNVLLLTSEGLDDDDVIGRLLETEPANVRVTRSRGFAASGLSREKLGPYAARAVSMRPAPPRGRLTLTNINSLPYYQRHIIEFMGRNTEPETSEEQANALLGIVAQRLKISANIAGPLEEAGYRHLGIRLPTVRARARVRGVLNHYDEPTVPEPSPTSPGVSAGSPASSARETPEAPQMRAVLSALSDEQLNTLVASLPHDFPLFFRRERGLALDQPSTSRATTTGAPVGQPMDVRGEFANMTDLEIDEFLTNIRPGVAEWLRAQRPLPTAQPIVRESPGRPDFGGISQSMEEVLRLTSEGFSDAEIAAFLGIVSDSVKVIRNRAFTANRELSRAKLGAYATRALSQRPVLPMGAITREDISTLPYFQRQVIEFVARNNMPGAPAAQIESSLATITAALKVRPGEAALLEARAYYHLGMRGPIDVSRWQVHAIMRNSGEPVATAKRRAYESDDEGEGTPKDGMANPPGSEVGQVQQDFVQQDVVQQNPSGLPQIPGEPVLPVAVNLGYSGTAALPIQETPAPIPIPEIPIPMDVDPGPVARIGGATAGGSSISFDLPAAPSAARVGGFTTGGSSISFDAPLMQGPAAMSPFGTVSDDVAAAVALANQPQSFWLPNANIAASPQPIPASQAREVLRTLTNENLDTLFERLPDDLPDFLSGIRGLPVHYPTTTVQRLPDVRTTFADMTDDQIEVFLANVDPGTADWIRGLGAAPPSTTPSASVPLLSAVAPAGPPPPIRGEIVFQGISDRQSDVLRLTFDGFTSKEIGDLLDLSAKDVDNARYQGMHTLGMKPEDFDTIRSTRAPVSLDPDAIPTFSAADIDILPYQQRMVLKLTALSLPQQAIADALGISLREVPALENKAYQNLEFAVAFRADAPPAIPGARAPLAPTVTDPGMLAIARAQAWLELGQPGAITPTPGTTIVLTERGNTVELPFPRPRVAAVPIQTPPPFSDDEIDDVAVGGSANSDPVVVVPTTMSGTIPARPAFGGMSFRQSEVLRYGSEGYNNLEIGDLMKIGHREVLNARYEGMRHLEDDASRTAANYKGAPVPREFDVNAPPVFSADEIDALPYYQRMVIKLTAMDLSPDAIAEALKISPDEVAAHERKAYQNLKYPVAFKAVAAPTVVGARTPLAPTTTSPALLTRARARVRLELGNPAPIHTVASPGTTVTVSEAGSTITVTVPHPSAVADPGQPATVASAAPRVSPGMPDFGAITKAQRTILRLTYEGATDKEISETLALVEGYIHKARSVAFGTNGLSREKLGPYAMRALSRQPVAPSAVVTPADISVLPFFQRNVIGLIARAVAPGATAGQIDEVFAAVAETLKIDVREVPFLEKKAYEHLGMTSSLEVSRWQIRAIMRDNGGPLAPAAAHLRVPVPSATQLEIPATPTAVETPVAAQARTDIPAPLPAPAPAPAPAAVARPALPSPGRPDFGTLAEGLEEVLRLTSEGVSDAAIAKLLYIGVGGVATKRSRAFSMNGLSRKKLGLYASRTLSERPAPPAGPPTREDFDVLPYFQRHVIGHLAMNVAPRASAAEIATSLETITATLELRPGEAAVLEATAYFHLGLTGPIEVSRAQIRALIGGNEPPVPTAKRSAAESDDDSDDSYGSWQGGMGASANASRKPVLG